ncbi:hypothetical protein KAR91_54720 [Candidatus Pacearchaeota archaeon]|nr:hypothetical protein [Candidatus Pacearchaeota archaeon]
MSLLDGVVARWGMNELAGANVADSFGSLDGTASGASIDIIDPILGPACREFDGTDDTINFGNVLAYDNDEAFSWAGWLKPVTGGNNTFLTNITQSIKKGYSLSLVGNELRLDLFSTSSTLIRVDSIPLMTLAAWNSFMVSYDGSGDASGVLMWINGNAGQTIGANSLSTSIVSVNDLVFGERPGSTIDYNGLADELVNWNRVMTGTDASDFWNGGAGIQVVQAGSPAYYYAQQRLMEG